MENSIIITWGARIFILLAIGFFIWWILRRNKTFQYTGLVKYIKSSGTQLSTLFTKKAVKEKRINKTEQMCRKIIEKIYNCKFKTIRPDFLKSPLTNKNLELDCYNADLRIALEYNGPQHYTYTPVFHKNKKNFYSQVHRDDWKRKRCRELGIRLIEVPYWIVPADLETFIVGELKKKGCL